MLTLLAYLGALALYRRSGAHPLLIPVLTAVVFIVVVLMATGTPYATYRDGVSLLSLLIGPGSLVRGAGCAAVWPACTHPPSMWRPLCIALLVGSAALLHRRC